MKYVASELDSVKIALPSKQIQPVLETVIGLDCNSAVELEGNTDLTIMGRQLGTGCKVTALKNTEDSLLAVDFEQGVSCSAGFSVELDAGTMWINGLAMVEFSGLYKDITIIMVSILREFDHCISHPVDSNYMLLRHRALVLIPFMSKVHLKMQQ